MTPAACCSPLELEIAEKIAVCQDCSTNLSSVQRLCSVASLLVQTSFKLRGRLSVADVTFLYSGRSESSSADNADRGGDERRTFAFKKIFNRFRVRRTIGRRATINPCSGRKPQVTKSWSDINAIFSRLWTPSRLYPGRSLYLISLWH